MSILGKIFGRIFPKANAGQAPAATQSAPSQPAGQPQAAPAGAAAATVNRVDIEQVLDGMAANNPQKLNWRTSIVDLMKLVGMDSTAGAQGTRGRTGLQRRQEQTAAMNMWLHKQVMKRMADNGGKVPANLMD